jgi:cobalamin biosynthesis Mg chelatase CobN
MIPLTLRAMLGMRHPLGRRAGRSSFLLPLVLALLAFASVPGLAQADSGGAQYETAVPTVTGHKSSPTHSSNPGAKSSNSRGGATAPSESEGKESSGSASSSNNASGGGGGNTGTGGGTGSGQTSPGDGSSGKTQSGGNNGPGGGTLNKAQPVSNATEGSDNSSSSPLVPILIAIVVLAAISVGAVIYRQRHQRPGSTVSPKAS